MRALIVSLVALSMTACGITAPPKVVYETVLVVCPEKPIKDVCDPIPLLPHRPNLASYALTHIELEVVAQCKDLLLKAWASAHTNCRVILEGKLSF